MKKTIFATLILILTMNSCGFVKHVNYYQPDSPTSSINVIYSDQQIPEDLTIIGNVSVRGKRIMRKKNRFYFSCLEKVKSEAIKMGGEYIHIIGIEAPGVWSDAGYSITADVYRKNIDKK